MAELADAPGWGPGRGNPVEVQVLFPAFLIPFFMPAFDMLGHFSYRSGFLLKFFKKNWKILPSKRRYTHSGKDNLVENGITWPYQGFGIFMFVNSLCIWVKTNVFSEFPRGGISPWWRSFRCPDFFCFLADWRCPMRPETVSNPAPPCWNQPQKVD